MYKEKDYLMLSGIQHYYFCKRQWSLIHVEQQWKDNRWTAEGQILHEKADNPYIKEKRKGIFFSRAMPVASSKLGISGILDVVEFTKVDSDGISIVGKKGIWKPVIVEFKRGKEKKDDRDVVQLVAQVICLEETLDTDIPYSYLYYNQTNKKVRINITPSLRAQVEDICRDMHDIYKRGRTLQAESYKNCKECSLYDICMPRLTKKKVNVSNYMNNHIDEIDEDLI
ncbi:CRISPR-associated protein Cas4 [Corticicoccus populi]|uniref:CRISPR-associated exonuclease Cas4 n=1 Tax=Corticicoccus populi TaxID=1812821 RepID=A0ABW5WTZ3_9STAP